MNECLAESPHVWLAKVNAINRKICLELKTNGQVADNAQSLKQARIMFFASHPYIIYADKLPVGFVLICDFKKAKQMHIWRLMIDDRYQRRGYGTQAVEQIVEKYIQKKYRIIKTSCMTANVGAIKFFENLGFEIHHDEESDEVETELYFKHSAKITRKRGEQA